MICIAVMNVPAGLKIKVSDGCNQASVFRSRRTLSLQPIFRLSKTPVESQAQGGWGGGVGGSEATGIKRRGGKTMKKNNNPTPTLILARTPSSVTSIPVVRRWIPLGFARCR